MWPSAVDVRRGLLVAGDLRLACALGRTGVRPASDKREGDGATPAGTWPIRRVLCRPDKTALPALPWPVGLIAPDDGWCDAPESAHYNRPVKLPFGASAERLWRDDDLYDILVVLGHNDAPVVAGAGSAIFLHVARADLAPTEGCVAVTRTDLMALLTLVPAIEGVHIREAAA